MAQGPPRRTPSTKDAKPNRNGATTGYEAQLWQMADALRGSMDAAEYKHVASLFSRAGASSVFSRRRGGHVGHTWFGAGKVDQPAEAVLDVLCRQGLHPILLVAPGQL